MVTTMRTQALPTPRAPRRPSSPSLRELAIREHAKLLSYQLAIREAAHARAAAQLALARAELAERLAQQDALLARA